MGSPTVSDNSPATGATFMLSTTVRNAGDGAAAATTLRYRRSTDATISASDTEVGTDAVETLAAAGTSAESIDLTAPSTAGTYYYGACVDAVTDESDTTNNCSSSVQVTVSEPAATTAPDLEVGSPTVSDNSPATGATFMLSTTVRNAGDGAAAATTLRYRRSTDATISASDTEVGTDAVETLAAAGTSAESIDLTAPSTAGTYYYGACVDAVTDESDTTNNCSSSVQVTVSEPAATTAPDLEVGSPTVSDNSPATGATFMLSTTVRNAGDGAAAATTLRYRRSTDATISASDTEVGTDAVETLAAAGTSAESIDLTAPSTAGTYYYGACVDAVTDESDTTNNCSSSVQVTVSEPAATTAPDLEVGSPTVSDNSPATGATFMLSTTVRNAGDGAAAATTLRYRRSTDATISASDTEVGTDAVETLAAAGTSAESIDLTAPSTAGTYYYGACVDAVTDESDTTNNCSSSVQVTVSEPAATTAPDLEVGSPTVSDSSPATGATFMLSTTVRNAGDGAAAATTLRYRRSTDGTITTSDTSVGTDAVGGLAAWAVSVESINLTAPSTAGTYYYGACVDAVADESDTMNNCSASVQVTVPAPTHQAPRTSFGGGTWRVNTDIAPGRYFTNPSSGCYWERLSGTGGTTAEILANEFIGFNSAQEIVDISSSDYAFKPDSDCGTWRLSAPVPAPAAGSIPPGRWLVGRQVPAGEYETNAQSGCYWERLSGFSGNSRDIIANDFVGDAGRQIISISSSDEGFYSDSDCGTWSRLGSGFSVSEGAVSSPVTDSGTIDRNRQMHRMQSGLR